MSIELAENNLWFSFLDETTSNDFRVWISTGWSGLSSKLRHFAKMWIVETGDCKFPLYLGASGTIFTMLINYMEQRCPTKILSYFYFCIRVRSQFMWLNPA